MYDNHRMSSYTNMSSRPCRMQYSRWSLAAPTTESTLSTQLPQPTAALSSSFYFPQSTPIKQVHGPNYVNCYPSSSSSSHLLNYDRPKSTIISDLTSANQSALHINDFRQRCESKPVVGIVKPMIHQSPFTQLNHHNNNTKLSNPMMNSYHQDLTQSKLSIQSNLTSSVIYRSHPTSSYNNIHSQPPMAPRRHSSISSSSRGLSSHRSSRTTSTSSSNNVINQLSLIVPSNEDESQQINEKIIIDVKRLEMFYGSVGTLVKSARSIARLYTTTTRQISNFEEWPCQQRGVPVWIYNTGANLKRSRQIRLLLAQHDSCFAIWSSLVTNQAELCLSKDKYITCWLPESNLLVVFKFERDDACRLFFRNYYEILEHERHFNLQNSPSLPTANSIERQQQTNAKEIPRRYSRLRTTSSKHDKQQQEYELRRCRSLSKIRTVKKSAISGPINFEHVNHISNNLNQERPLSGTVTLRSLHASMSHLPNNGTLTDRLSRHNKNCASIVFEPRTTEV